MVCQMLKIFNGNFNPIETFCTSLGEHAYLFKCFIISNIEYTHHTKHLSLDLHDVRNYEMPYIEALTTYCKRIVDYA